MLTLLRRLLLRSTIFIFVFSLATFSLSHLQTTDTTTLVSTHYSLPNNQPYQYSSVLAALPVKRADIKTSFKIADARTEILRQYLERYKSPLEPHANLIVELSDQYDFDYRWLVAIAQQESNLCKYTPVNSHNCWGWGIYPDPNNPGELKVTRFSSYDDALKRIAPQFKQIFLGDSHYKDPLQVMKKYTPPSDGSWAFGVSQFFAELE